MHEQVKRRCEAVVVRVSPDVASGEVLNIGVIVRAPDHRFFAAKLISRWTRVASAFPDADVPHLARVARAIVTGCAREYATALELDPHPESITDAVRRFLPDEDASIVLSAPISGVTADPAKTLDELFVRFVTHGVRRTSSHRSRGDDDVWRGVSKVLRDRGLLDKLEPNELHGKHHTERFEASWMNGHLHVARPVSLDLADPEKITEKAAAWTGRVRVLDPKTKDVSVLLVVGMPPESSDPDLVAASTHGLELLREELASIAEVFTEDDAEMLADRIEADLAHHSAAMH